MYRSLKRVAAMGAVMALVTMSLQGVASAATPTVPTDLVAVGGNELATLTWTASSNSPTDYIIEYSADGFVTTTTRFFDAVSTTASATVTGLTNGTTYSFKVKGFNADGTSAASTATTAVPYSNHTPNRHHIGRR